jgi:hypothetical protein
LLLREDSLVESEQVSQKSSTFWSVFCFVSQRANFSLDRKMSFNTSFAFGKVIKKKYPDALAAVEAVLKENGFGIISRIDFQAAFKEKLQKGTNF